eukprot:TRINITY_DN68_c0_g1_i2.p1 TRINITY_DN68_c0_g1~~TRINITY_DN68_c0_g1_i2.p1  ORF type:complete len:935 (-),score=256.11 TRINITY_DN68_c0_g1_i2:96-2879(-)
MKVGVTLFLGLCLICVASLVFGAPLQYTGVNEAGAEFDSGTFYPVPASYNHLQALGMNVFRVPFKWERLQPNLGGAFDSAEQTRLVNSITDITKNGAYAIIDPHNYARYQGNVIGGNTVSNSQFQAFWQSLASLFVNNPRVIFGVMNEPRDMATEQWLSASNAAIVGIRASGAKQLILVPGNGYTGAHSWTGNWYGTPNAQVMTGTVDSGNNYAFEVHQYFDGDYSGTNSGCKSGTIGSEVMPPLTTWARSNNYKVFVGEFGAGNNPTCQSCITNFLSYLESNSDVYIGWTWWAAGPQWGDYFTSIEPVNGQDKPQTSWLYPFLSGPRTANYTGGGGSNPGGGGSNAAINTTAAVYVDSLQGSWSAASTWAQTYSLSNSGQYTYPNPNSGNSISWQPNSFDALYFTCTADAGTTCFDNTFGSISFYVNGGASGGGINIRVQLRDASKSVVGAEIVITTQANNWVLQTIPISSFNANGPFTGFTIQEHSGQSPRQTIYIDNIYVNRNANPSTPTATRSAVYTASSTNTATATRSAVVAASSTNTATATSTATATATRSAVAPSVTSTNTATRSIGASLSSTNTATATATATRSAVVAASSTNTATATATRAAGASSTNTATATATRAAGASSSNTRTATAVPSFTSNPSRGSSASASPSSTNNAYTQAIYIDSLQNNWQFSSQPNQFNQQASSPTFANSRASISYAPNGNSNDRLPFACYNSVCLNQSVSYGIQFQAHAGSGSGQTFTIQLTQNNNVVGNALNFRVPGGGVWTRFQFNYNQFGSLPAGFLNGFVIQGTVGTVQPATYFDSVYVIGSAGTAQVAFSGQNKKRVGQDNLSNGTADAIGLNRDQAYSVDGQTVGLVGLSNDQLAAAQNVGGWLATFNAAQQTSYTVDQVSVRSTGGANSDNGSQQMTGAGSTLSGFMSWIL